MIYMDPLSVSLSPLCRFCRFCLSLCLSLSQSLAPVVTEGCEERFLVGQDDRVGAEALQVQRHSQQTLDMSINYQ